MTDLTLDTHSSGIDAYVVGSTVHVSHTCIKTFAMQNKTFYTTYTNTHTLNVYVHILLTQRHTVVQSAREEISLVIQMFKTLFSKFSHQNTPSSIT